MLPVAGYTMIALLSSLLVLVLAEGQSLKSPLGSTVDDIMNTCLDGRNHKSKPGAESDLFQHVR
jgi:hypothetical protein